MIDRIVWSGLSVGRSRTASTAMPRNSPPRIVATHVSVIAALRDSGLRNAWIPFEIASTPLSATAPDENARSSKNTDAPVEHRVRPGEVLQAPDDSRGAGRGRRSRRGSVPNRRASVIITT